MDPPPSLSRFRYGHQRLCTAATIMPSRPRSALVGPNASVSRDSELDVHGDATKERRNLLRQAHRIHLVGSGEAFQNNVAARIETDVAGTLRQLAQQRRREDLAAGGFPCDARGEDDAAAVEVVALADRLARMQADAHAHRM